MILTSKKDGVVTIPLKNGVDFVVLVPSTSEVDDVLWAEARNTAKNFIDAGVITEEWVKVDVAGTENMPLVLESDDKKETTKRLVPARLSDIDRRNQKIQKVVASTYHMPTLLAWDATELRADVRLDIRRQIEAVESGKIKG